MAFPDVEARAEQIRQKLGKHGLSSRDLKIIAEAQATGEIMRETQAPIDGKLAKRFTKLASSDAHNRAVEHLIDADNKLRNG